MPKRQKPFIVRIQAEGTTGEKLLTREELVRKVSTFNSRLEGYPLQMRLDALESVMDKVRKDPTKMDFLKALLKTRKWDREIAVLLGQQERLKTLRKGR